MGGWIKTEEKTGKRNTDEHNKAEEEKMSMGEVKDEKGRRAQREEEQR